MNRRDRVVIVSPGAQVEIAQLARSMRENTIPFVLISTALISEKAQKLLFFRIFLKRTQFYSRIANRIIEVNRSQSKTPFLIFEFIRVYLPNSIQGKSLIIRNLLFDIYAAIWILIQHKYIAAAIFQHHSGALAIRMANKLKIKTILNISIAHHDWIKLENDFEKNLNPKWAYFLQFREFSRYQQWILENECRYSNHFLVASSFTKSTLSITSSKTTTHVIPLGTSINSFEFHERIRNPDQTFRIIVVGQLTQRKGISYILEAYESAALPSASKLIFAGRDSSGMKKILEKYQHVEVLGHLSKSELELLMSQADLFICNSLVEGFSLATLDAMASGLPVIASDRTFAGDIIDNGVNGFIVDPRNVSQLASTIRLVYDNPILARKISRASFETANRFTWDFYRKNISCLITKIIQE